jgi:hypothetical protein
MEDANKLQLQEDNSQSPEQTRYASFWIRFLAFSIDFLILIVIKVILNILFLLILKVITLSSPNLTIWLFWIVASCAYFIVTTKKYNATAGKYFLGTEVKSSVVVYKNPEAKVSPLRIIISVITSLVSIAFIVGSFYVLVSQK